MTTDQELRAQFNDILDEMDDVVDLEMVRHLQAAYPQRRPPAALARRLTASWNQSREQAPSHEPAHVPGFSFPARRRRTLAALLVALAGIGAGTSGLATAAIHTVRTHLFDNPPASPQAAVWVGSFVPPLWGGCAPRPTTSPVVAPDGRRFAQLGTVPDGFTDSVAVTFPPCLPRPLRPGVVPPKPSANFAWETITVVSVVRYTGSSGQIEIDTGQATAEGMRRGLYLGNPAGTLSDGTPVFDLGDNLRWLKDGMIVSLSGDPPVERLKEIASDVTLK